MITSGPAVGQEYIAAARGTVVDVVFDGMLPTPLAAIPSEFEPTGGSPQVDETDRDSASASASIPAFHPTHLIALEAARERRRREGMTRHESIPLC